MVNCYGFYPSDRRPRIYLTSAGFLSATERNRLVNSKGVVNQRFAEFWTEILGSGKNHRGSFRNLTCLSRNGEFSASGQIDVKPCSKGVKSKTPGGRNLGSGR